MYKFRNILYVGIPKTGTTCINRCFNFFKEDNTQLYRNKHESLLTYFNDNVDNEENNSLIVFCSIRNIFEYYISWYNYIKEAPTYTIRELKEVADRGIFKDFLNFVMKECDENFLGWIDFSIMRRLDIGWYTYFYIKICCDYKKVFISKKTLNDFYKNPSKYTLINSILFFEEDLNVEFTKMIYFLNKSKLIDFKYTKNGENIIKNIGKIHSYNKNSKYIREDYIDDYCFNLIMEKDKFLFNLFNNKKNIIEL